jgi:hypothetical protein
MQPARRLAAASFAAALIATPGVAQTFEICTAEADGTFTPHFEVTPSMVVHSNAVLDLTRGDIGLDGTATEKAFSFNRTIEAILKSVGAASDHAAQVAFVQNLLDTMVPAPSFALNAEAGVQMPLDQRAEQTELDAEKLLDHLRQSRHR